MSEAYKQYLAGKPVILWRGPSALDSSRQAVAVLKRTTTNRKTGPCHQLAIFDAGQAENGHVGAGCVKCPLTDVCYIRGPHRWGLIDVHAELDSLPVVPRSQWHKFIYDFDRLGEYGDPGALPDKVIKPIVRFSRGHVGYTHFFRQRPSLAGLLQASCETWQDVLDARALGFKVYYVVRLAGRPVQGRSIEDDKVDAGLLRQYMGKSGITGAVVCPYYSTGKTCLECKLCNGSKVDVIAPAHGSGSNKYPGDWVDGDSLQLIEGPK